MGSVAWRLGESRTPDDLSSLSSMNFPPGCSRISYNPRLGERRGITPSLPHHFKLPGRLLWQALVRLSWATVQAEWEECCDFHNGPWLPTPEAS